MSDRRLPDPNSIDPNRRDPSNGIDKGLERLYQRLQEGRQRRIERGDLSPNPAPVVPQVPDCAICDDLGYVTRDVPIDHPDFGKPIPCRCQIDKRHALHTQRIRDLSDLTAYADKTFETFSLTRPGLTDDQRMVLSNAWQMAGQYAQMPTGWLLLAGSYGTGKTHLAAAIANYRVIAFEEQALLITAPDLLDHLRATYAPDSDVGYDDVFERVRNTPLLVIDDLGAESPTTWAKEKFYQLLNHRHARRLPTVITTNVALTELDDRIRSRLSDRTLVQSVQFDLPDQRGAAVQTELNLTNLDRYAAMTFETFSSRDNENLADQRTFESVIGMARGYATAPSGWLALLAKSGTGKTHLAAAIAHERKQAGDSLVFVSCATLLDYLRAAFAPDSAISFDQRLYQVKTADFVVIDDLAIGTHTSEWAREKLYDVLLHRFDYNLPTVITSTHEVRQMDARIASRVGNLARCTALTWNIPPYTGGAARIPSRQVRRIQA